MVYKNIYIYLYIYIRPRGRSGRSQNRCFFKMHDKGMDTSLCCPTRAMINCRVDREKLVPGSGVPGQRSDSRG